VQIPAQDIIFGHYCVYPTTSSLFSILCVHTITKI